jgi:hypothetical protein
VISFKVDTKHNTKPKVKISENERIRTTRLGKHIKHEVRVNENNWCEVQHIMKEYK